MVTIEQVELLEEKVSKAIDYIQRLEAENGQRAVENDRLREEIMLFQTENGELSARLAECTQRVSDLDAALSQFKHSQERIEQGIVSALERLNRFEDNVSADLNNSAAESTPKTSEYSDNEENNDDEDSDSDSDDDKDNEENDIFLDEAKAGGGETDDIDDENDDEEENDEDDDDNEDDDDDLETPGNSELDIF